MQTYEAADLIIYIKGRGIVLKEPSLVALNTITWKVLAVGEEAQQLMEHPVDQMNIISPLHRGRIADYLVAVELFSSLVRKAWGKRLFPKPAMTVCVPQGSTEVERKAIYDLFYQIGAREVFLAEIPLEELLQKLQRQELPKVWQSSKFFVCITKDKPIRYLTEQIQELCTYAMQEGFSVEQVEQLFQEIRQTQGQQGGL